MFRIYLPVIAAILASLWPDNSLARPKIAEVKSFNGRPTIFVDGQPEAPAFYALTHAYGGRWSWEEVASRNLQNFCNIGTRLFQVDLYFEDIWKKNSDSLNIALAQKQVRGVLDVCPQASVVIRVHVNAPFWWNEANPDECTQYADGPLVDRPYGAPFNNEDGDTERALRASLASAKWRAEAGERLKEFCQRMAATTEGQSVIGLHICGGIYGEWHYWGFIPHDPDTGPAMTRYFREWLTKKYNTDKALQCAWNNKTFTLATASVPGTDERNHTTAGIFHDPQKEQRVIDYFEAQQEVVAEDIEYFCKIAKDYWPRKLIVGVFYGYFHMTFCRQATGGHLFVERIMDCPYIDYLSAPQTYWNDSRALGGSGTSRGVIESALLHGKLWLDEMDNGFLQKQPARDDVRSVVSADTAYAAIIRRNALLPLMRGIGLWYYDFGIRTSFGWWDRPLYQQQIKEEKTLFDQWISEPRQSAADLLVVWDMETFYYVKNTWYPLCYNQLDQANEELLRCGVTGDHVYTFDLKRVNPAQYKAVLFMNTFRMTADERQLIRDKFARDGRTLIWNYLPGYTDGTRLNLDWVSENTGFDITPYKRDTSPVVLIKNPTTEYAFEGPVDPMVVITDKAAENLGTIKNSGEMIVGSKKFPGYHAVFATLPLHNSDVFRQLLKLAGCHVYNEENDFTFANNQYVMVHTKNGGPKVIALRNGKRISLNMPKASTWLLNATDGRIVLPTTSAD